MRSTLVKSLARSLVFAAALLCAVAEYDRAHNPAVIRLTFRNNSQSPVESGRLLRVPSQGGRPVALCLGTAHPDDVLCDIGSLLAATDIFQSDVWIEAVDTAIPDPQSIGKICIVRFEAFSTDQVNPMIFKDITCGLEKGKPSKEFITRPRNVDSMAALPQFKVANMTDLLVTSYNDGYECKHRLKRIMVTQKGRPKKRVRGGALFQLDSFYCDFGFGMAIGRPESEFKPYTLYKNDGRRWRPSGYTPDIL